MGTSNAGHHRYSFAGFVLDVDRGALLNDGAEVKLRPQSFSVLRHLVEHNGRLVSRDELLDAVWGNTVVTDGSLTQCLIDVRRAIGDDSRQLIRTLPRRGYIFEAPVRLVETRSPASPVRARPLARRQLAVAFICTAVAAVAVAWWVASRPGSPAAAGAAARPNSIAVLPFVDMSEARDQGYFSDGISEEILNTLAQSPSLHVIARTSSFSFKDKDVDIATIGERLNVAYVLEGSVRRAGDQVRITAQLVDTASSHHLWSESYDRKVGNVLELQSEIAAAVAAALNIALFSDAASRARAKATNPEAYEHYLQGRFFHNRRGPGDAQRAESHYRQALAINPTDARAWAGLAGTLVVRILDDGATAGSMWGAWKEAVEQALAHGPDLAVVHVRAAQYFWHTEQPERAAEHSRKALLLNPDDPLVLSSTAGTYTFRGQLESAIDLYQRAIKVDPLSTVLHTNAGNILAAAGRFDEALAEYRTALDLNPAYADFDLNVGLVFLAQHRLDEAQVLIDRWPDGIHKDMAHAMIYAGFGRQAEADAALQRLGERPGAEPARRVAEVHAWLGETEEAFRWLEKGRALGRADTLPQRGWWIDEARLSPFFIPLRDDPRWEQILAWEE